MENSQLVVFEISLTKPLVIRYHSPIFRLLAELIGYSRYVWCQHTTVAIISSAENHASRFYETKKDSNLSKVYSNIVQPEQYEL